MTSLIEIDQEFLERVVPWPQAKEAPGWINLHTHLKNDDPKKNGGKPFVVGWPFKTVDDFINRATWLETTDSFYDVWYCTSQQRESGTNTKGNPKAVRLARNATGLKALWYDVDIKAKPADWDTTNPGEPWKHYESLKEALNELTAFRRKVGLPGPSALVDSGGGLHVYWISDQPLDPATWLPYADGLKALALAEVFKCDTGLTTDSARILRVPGTLNHKYDPPRRVTLLGGRLGKLYNFDTELAFLKKFSSAKGRGVIAQGAQPVRQPQPEPIEHGAVFDTPDPAFAGLSPADSAVTAGIESTGAKLVEPTPIFQKCAFLGNALKDGGANYDQPLWHLSVLCTVFMTDGNDLAHEISKGHHAYTHGETQAMYERKLADRAQGIGPPRCATIHGNGCKACGTCPFLTEGKTPLHLTVPVTATVNPGPTTPAAAIWSPPQLRVTFANIRHRRTLYGYDLVRGEITVLGSPGGVGKSSLAIGVGVSIAAGKELLGEKLRGNDLKVLIINAEDSTDEIRRRVWAFCLAHLVSELELDRLYVVGADDPRVQRLSFLRTNQKGHSEVDQAGLAQLRSALQSLAPDVLVLDPLVALCANGNMNDNPSMSLVMRALKILGAEFDCAILVVHHTRKNAEAGIADAISGAASIVNLARRAIMPVPLTEEEASKLGIMPSERPQYFRLVDAKSNLAPRSSELPIYRLHGVELSNPEPPIYPFGDNVQAIARVQLPIQGSATGSTDEDKIRQVMLDLVEQGKTINGKSYPYTPSAAGNENARALLPDAIAAAQRATAPRQWATGDLESVVKHLFKKLTTEGVLESLPMKELVPSVDRFQKGRGLKVNRSRVPHGGTNATEA